ncbi:MAG: DNA topoisomerase IV subunit A [Paludibacterium sp.]|uniref:DNA topoisomerase IV subunit A n=1 Tax=Paludibacterium sp. TaxID=1917523 RepID=UPI0025FA052E|nr:DNA topoisomerase IV subunit A [Paludibacterium sp.]MBV8045533.1 DNA topoisomerase IV subunit A [Paludibacterium sp.]MBV8647990.1 DNA topoisomerase IV subunit A [Paludibacterium sp.]
MNNQDHLSGDLFDIASDTGAPPPPPPAAPAAAPASDDWIALDLYAERAYLEYAMSVVKGRALPEVADGQKPVQRRILYAMRDMGLVAGAKPVKSARVVGEILGKYHPHGDSSAYEAMVRMAQDFTLRYPLIDGQGNFGSRDGDGAAAMRYTEARLTPYADLLLSEIDMGTVDFVPNYDGAFEEPKLLPSRLPMLLLNGASGIAVGLATEIPPHNLTEVAGAAVALLDNPALTTAELMQHIPGPDFPGGGQIITPAEDILAAYESGRGSVRVRARWDIERLARGQWRVIVSELPPGSSAQKVLAEIEEATNPKPRPGKKALTQDQQNLKSLMLSMLDRVRDESDGNQPVRLVFEPKSSRQDPDEFVQMLLAQTSLEGNASLNLVMIGLDGRPGQRGLKPILEDWLAFRSETVTRRLAHRLAQVEKRIHILEGRMIAFIHIDEVIRVIRESDEPKPDLIKAFGLSEAQAEDILEIRLRQLARLEGFKLEKELSELREEREGLRHLLDTPEAKRALIVEEIRADAAKYGDARRTEIKAAQRAVLSQTVADEPITIILSQKGWLRARVGHNLDLSTLTFKDGDAQHTIVETRTVWPIVVLDNLGRAYTVNAADVPTGRGDGVPVASLIELQDGGKPCHMLSGPETARYVVASSSGYGFIATVGDMAGRVKAGKAFITLEEGDGVIAPVPVPTDVAQVDLQLVAAADNGRLLAFSAGELRDLAKGRGLMLIQLDQGERLTAIGLARGEKVLLSVLSARGKSGEEKLALAEYLGRRAKRGKLLPKKWSILAITDL